MKLKGRQNLSIQNLKLIFIALSNNRYYRQYMFKIEMFIG